MAESLREEFRLPVAWVEDASADTWENATFSARILREQGIHSVYLVTHGWHMRRAVRAFQKAGLAVTAFPTLIDSPSGLLLTDYVPGMDALRDTYYAAHEWIGDIWYAVR